MRSITLNMRVCSESRIVLTILVEGRERDTLQMVGKLRCILDEYLVQLVQIELLCRHCINIVNGDELSQNATERKPSSRDFVQTADFSIVDIWYWFSLHVAALIGSPSVRAKGIVFSVHEDAALSAWHIHTCRLFFSIGSRRTERVISFSAKQGEWQDMIR